LDVGEGRGTSKATEVSPVAPSPAKEEASLATPSSPCCCEGKVVVLAASPGAIVASVEAASSGPALTRAGAAPVNPF
jgi:hypothetical protein